MPVVCAGASGAEPNVGVGAFGLGALLCVRVDGGSDRRFKLVLFVQENDLVRVLLLQAALNCALDGDLPGAARSRVRVLH